MSNNAVTLILLDYYCQ